MTQNRFDKDTEMLAKISSPPDQEGRELGGRNYKLRIVLGLLDNLYREYHYSAPGHQDAPASCPQGHCPGAREGIEILRSMIS